MSLAGFWQEITGKTNSNYDDDNVVEFGFSASFLQIHYVSGTNPIYYSFNGSEDHGKLYDSVGSIQTQMLNNVRQNKVWFRGGSGDEIIEVKAHPHE